MKNFLQACALLATIGADWARSAWVRGTVAKVQSDAGTSPVLMHLQVAP